VAKPSHSSPIDLAAAGEGLLSNALRSHGLGRLSGADQTAISDILGGGRSTLEPIARGKPALPPGPTPPAALATPIEPSPHEDRKRGTVVTSVADIGDLVRQARVRLGFNQQRFADIAGVGRRFVSELEAGKGSVETERLLRCCLAAGIDLFARPRQS
jgi:y4mF family transcriptional regulator